jgi:hypothetical protein
MGAAHTLWKCVVGGHGPAIDGDDNGRDRRFSWKRAVRTSRARPMRRAVVGRVSRHASMTRLVGKDTAADGNIVAATGLRGARTEQETSKDHHEGGPVIWQRSRCNESDHPAHQPIGHAAGQNGPGQRRGKLLFQHDTVVPPFTQEINAVALTTVWEVLTRIIRVGWVKRAQRRGGGQRKPSVLARDRFPRCRTSQRAKTHRANGLLDPTLHAMNNPA